MFCCHLFYMQPGHNITVCGAAPATPLPSMPARRKPASERTSSTTLADDYQPLPFNSPLPASCWNRPLVWQRDCECVNLLAQKACTHTHAHVDTGTCSVDKLAHLAQFWKKICQLFVVALHKIYFSISHWYAACYCCFWPQAKQLLLRHSTAAPVHGVCVVWW